ERIRRAHGGGAVRGRLPGGGAPEGGGNLAGAAALVPHLPGHRGARSRRRRVRPGRLRFARRDAGGRAARGSARWRREASPAPGHPVLPPRRRGTLGRGSRLPRIRLACVLVAQTTLVVGRSSP